MSSWRLRWLGHVVIREEETMVKRVWKGRPDGTRLDNQVEADLRRNGTAMQSELCALNDVTKSFETPWYGQKLQVSYHNIFHVCCLGLSVSPKDMAGFVALQSLHRSRRPSFFSSPIFSLPTFSQNSRGSVSPISPIELVDSQDWNQISPLGRSKLPDMRNL